MNSKTPFVLTLIAFSLDLGRASADDLFPPPWRGQPLTTVAEWDFLTPAQSLPPDGTSVVPEVGDGLGPGVLPSLTVSGPMQWDAAFGGSWVNIGNPGQFGYMNLLIPNWIDNEPIKLLQIQLTVQPRSTGTPPTLEFPHVVLIHPTDPLPITEVSFLGESTIPIGDPIDFLFHRTERWRIMPNPDYEEIQILIPSDSLVSQVVVDTISFAVPEPSSIGLVGIGLSISGLLAAQRRIVRPSANLERRRGKTLSIHHHIP